MRWYELFKIVHFMGLIALFGFFVIQTQAGMRLRAARTVGDVRPWLGMLQATRGMLIGGVVMLAVSGFVMAGIRWRAPYPFVAVGLVTLLIIGIVQGVVSARHMRAIGSAAGDADGSIPGPLAQVILAPTPWGITATLNGAALGVLFDMTWKPGWVASAAVVLVMAALVGGIMTTVVRRQRDRAVTEPVGVHA